jgi:hypothetical protein
MIKSILTYEIQLWVTASTSNIEILDHFQSKDLLMTVDPPWYVPNAVIRTDLQTPTVKEVRHYRSQYSARLSVHPNELIVNLKAQPDNRRLRRHLRNDLSTKNAVFWDITPCGSYKNRSFGEHIASIFFVLWEPPQSSFPPSAILMAISQLGAAPTPHSSAPA